MIRTFFKKKPKLIPISKAKIELVSLHIPKTAGTSFRNILNLNYGAKSVAQFDIIVENDTVYYQLFGNRMDEPLVPEDTRVLHGHFEYYRLIDLCPSLSTVPTITWLRHPVKRVISNYTYLNAIFESLIADDSLALSLYPRLKNNLLEFASREYEQNRMTKFCKGLDIQKAFFVGIVENYEKDLIDLGIKLNWSYKDNIQDNITTKKKEIYSEDIYSIIEGFNGLDMQLYNSVKNK